ncbi:DUF6525 family protein [Pseudoponticoccus marisrubri]|uniref:Uncharacterized protein n=1 Tax=Pseudoponticoccus marisrubri TaxID=1685382 RepID=A0A0W7WLH2_9RHOB|nr:DUF6525 family protein [Pseudoponticoccus marisrubri]KUF11402.1 hypothetical protein AVJ23_06450 [Pseudoponticoccus marisrubri]
MPANLGTTTLRRKRHRSGAMRDYDRLPAELRAWLSTAVLPWRPGSVRQAYDRARARTGDPVQALAELDRLQERLVAKDASAVWGPAHPHASQGAKR